MKREKWKSRLGFVWAAVGSAIGLGSIWRFPYVVGENGGATFIFLYLICLVLVGFPVLITEITIGRATSLSPYGAFKKLSGSPLWGYFGKLTIVTGFLVSTFYGVIAGITLGYLLEAISGGITSLPSSAQAEAFFQGVTASPLFMVGSLTVLMAVCFGILFWGVQKGIEAGNKVMMPLLLIVLFLLAVKGLTMDGGDKALRFLLTPDFSKVTPATLILALGQAFFSLSLGQGTMVTYGSYLRDDENIPTTAVPITLFGILVSFLAGLAIFTIVFTYGLEPTSGESLMFHTLPVVFSNMTGGYFFCIAFFVLLFLAGLTSQISALEPMISYLSDEWKLKRVYAVCITCIGSYLIAIPCALSLGPKTGYVFFGNTLFSVIEYLCVNLLVPFGGLIAVFLLGWRWGIRKGIAQIRHGASGTFQRYPWLENYLRVSIRYIAPVVILLIFLDVMGLLRL